MGQSKEFPESFNVQGAEQLEMLNESGELRRLLAEFPVSCFNLKLQTGCIHFEKNVYTL